MSRLTYEALEQALEAFRKADGDEARERKRLRIIQAATDRFIEHGYRKTSVDDVARAAGVAKGTVYLYAKGKNDLLVQAIVEEKRRYLEHVRDLFAPEVEPRERLSRYIRTVLVLAKQMPLISKLFAGDHEILTVLEELDPEVAAQSEATQQQFLVAMLDEAAAPHRWTADELADRSRALYALLVSMMMLNESSRRGLSLERFADLAAELLVKGIAPRGGES